MQTLTMHEIQDRKSAKVTTQTIDMAYYDSTRNPVYLTRRLQSFFDNAPHYKQNWVSLIVDAVCDKLVIEGLSVTLASEQDKRQDRLDEIWDNEGLNQEADIAHLYAHMTGEGFMIAEEVDNKSRAFAVDPRAVVVYYGGMNPKEITQAVYFWLEGEMFRATEWYVDNERVYRKDYKGTKRTSTDDTPANKTNLSYTPIGEEHDTGYSRIPVFHFMRTGRSITSEFYKVRAIQDVINKTFVSQGFMIEKAADDIRYIITSGNVADVSKAKAGDVVGIAPAAANTQPVSVGSFSVADYNGLTSIIDNCVMAMSAITATPYFYFNRNTGTQISGEALQALEAPLVAKVSRYKKRHAPVWEALGAFLLTIEGMDTDTSEVTCNYADSRTVLPMTEAQVLQTNKAAGIPLITQLRARGWRQSELNQMLEDRDTEMPVTMDEAAITELQDRITENTTAMIEPMLDQTIQLISDMALKRATESVDLIAQQVQNAG